MNGLIFHATRDRFISKIRKEGIRAKKKKSFEGQVGNELIYFAYDYNVAASYVESADNIPEEWEYDNIIILAVKQYELQPAYVFPDPNLPDEDFTTASTLAYGLTVPPNLIGVLNFKENKIEPLLTTRICSKHYYT